MLTEAQLSMFNVFGFVVLRGVFGPDEMGAANSDFETGLKVAEAAMERTGIRGQINWSSLRPETPFLASLLEDERFLGPATQILGQETIGSFSNCNSFDGDRTEWHPDVSGQDWRGVKFGFYLQPLDALSGALRLIPGSHREPLHSDMRGIELSETFKDGERANGLSVQEVPAFVADSTPGDVVAFDNRTWHASYGGFRGRRMCTAGYFAAPTAPGPARGH